MNERLRSCERIRRKKDFLNLYKEGRRFRGRYFNLVYLPSSGRFSRVAVVVSRKVGGAVERNRIKRWMREAFRKNKGLLGEPIDVILVARREIREATGADVAAALAGALGKLFGKEQTS